MRRLILHIGAAKCASSSLQSYLSEKFVSNEFQTSPYAGRYKYLSVFADGRVGDGLASYPFAEIAAQPLAIFEAALAQLEPGQSAIMSCEGWGLEIMQLDLAAAFAQLNVALEIFCVVRLERTKHSRLGSASHSQYPLCRLVTSLCQITRPAATGSG